MKKLGFKHQHCIYHLRLAINERNKKFLKQKDIEFIIQECWQKLFNFEHF